jgi:hypothetical protein
VLGVEGLLQRVPLPVREALDGGDLGAVGLHRQHGAALHGHAVQVHRARATVGGVAADRGTGLAEPVSQVMDKQQAGFHLI